MGDFVQRCEQSVVASVGGTSSSRVTIAIKEAAVEVRKGQSDVVSVRMCKCEGRGSASGLLFSRKSESAAVVAPALMGSSSSPSYSSGQPARAADTSLSGVSFNARVGSALVVCVMGLA